MPDNDTRDSLEWVIAAKLRALALRPDWAEDDSAIGGHAANLADAVLAAGFTRQDDTTALRIRELLSDFSTYPSDDRNFTITDHMFVDFEFWDRLVAIIDGPVPTEGKET